MASITLCDYHTEKEHVPAVATVAALTLHKSILEPKATKDTCLEHLESTVSAIWALGQAIPNFHEVRIQPVN